MKKTTLFCSLIFAFLTINVFSQARKELNFGLVGANYEIPVHKDITIAPGASTNFNLDWLTLHLKANYYFDNLFGITNSSWDVYGGAVAGYAIYNGNDNKDNDIDVGLQVGGRWFWNDKWGVYLELGGGSASGGTGGLGLTVKL
ncbi:MULTISPECIES: hypothetical protein [Flavobacterium]|uniref:hypothetical protein n=1 Tax=Flavobacterium TaxID=237 RepID=UPI0022AC4F99|nr:MULTISPECIES: hypothetical protein [Flavobacterium]